MEEAFATFVADVGLYWSNATQPHSCITAAQSPCPPGVFNLESSTGAAGVCAANEDRFPLTYERVFWDIYDTSSDCRGSICDTTSASVDTIHSVWGFPDGLGNNQSNEGWSCFFGCWPSDRDARNIVDYTDRFFAVTGMSTVSTRTINCN